jgi:hypothetical protein
VAHHRNLRQQAHFSYELEAVGLAHGNLRGLAHQIQRSLRECLERQVDPSAIRVGGDHEDGRRPSRHDALGGGQPVHPGHLDVHHHQVGLEIDAHLHRFFAVVRDSHDRQVGFGVDDVAEDRGK